jgi:hypothetical protein
MGMFGEELKLITIQCSVCKKMIALRVDPQDLRRHREQGVYVQHAFIDRAGKPYLTAAERELFLSGCCEDCWNLLCPSGVLAYN